MKITRPIIILLCAGAASVLLYRYLKGKNKEAALPTTKTVPPAVTTEEKIIITASKGLSNLSDAQIKKYATWIDRIEQILQAYRETTGEKYGRPTVEAIANAEVLGKLSYENLLAVVTYWQTVRKRKVITALSMFTETSPNFALSNLVKKLKNYKIIT